MSTPDRICKVWNINRNVPQKCFFYLSFLTINVLHKRQSYGFVGLVISSRAILS